MLAKESGAAPAPAGAPAAKSAATSGAAPAPPAAGGGAAPAAKKLPKTASQQPLVGLIGLLSLMTAVALTTRRRWQGR